MRKPPAKSRQRSEEEILDQATSRLLKATKQEAKKRGRPINYESLRREGYSERFIEKVREA
jgi:predicted GNAT family N-acyltransferase